MSLKASNILLGSAYTALFCVLSAIDTNSPKYSLWLIVVMLAIFLASFFLYKRTKTASVNTLLLLFVVGLLTVVITTVTGAFCNFFFRFFITGIAYFLVGYYFLHRYKPVIPHSVVFMTLFLPQIVLLMPLMLFQSDNDYVKLLPFASMVAWPLIWLTSRTKPFWAGAFTSLSLIIILAFIVYPNYISWQMNKVVDAADPRIQFPLINANGDTLHVADLRGKIVVLDFWYSKCGYCYKGFPHFDGLRTIYKDNPNIVFAAVNVPIDSDPVAFAFEELKQYGFATLKTTANLEKNDWKIKGFPVNLVYDATGRLRFEGQLDYDRMVVNNAYSLLDRLLKP